MNITVTVQVSYDFGPTQSDAEILNAADQFLWRHLDQRSFMVKNSGYRMAVSPGVPKEETKDDEG